MPNSNATFWVIFKQCGPTEITWNIAQCVLPVMIWLGCFFNLKWSTKIAFPSTWSVSQIESTVKAYILDLKYSSSGHEVLLFLLQIGVCLLCENSTNPKHNIDISKVDEEHFLVFCWKYKKSKLDLKNSFSDHKMLLFFGAKFEFVYLLKTTQ